MKKTAKAPSNIAFIKYWGKKDPSLNLPMNDSVSMNLSGCSTLTTVEFNSKFKKDRLILAGQEVFDKKLEKVSKHLDLVRKLARKNLRAKVTSKNNFPTGVGIASSASGFAALTLAAVSALGLKLSEKELSVLARLGSGSACRSIPDGFVNWHKGQNSQTSFAESIAPPSYWNLADIVVILQDVEKEISSRDGHALAQTSPYYKTRLSELGTRTKDVEDAIKKKDLEKLGTLIEEEAISLHMVAMTSKPPLFYWKPETLLLMQNLMAWRKEGLPAYFTIDAGPNIHIITEDKYEDKVTRKLKQLGFPKQTITNHPSEGARIVD